MSVALDTDSGIFFLNNNKLSYLMRSTRYSDSPMTRHPCPTKPWRRLEGGDPALQLSTN